MNQKNSWILGITGATGSVYGTRLLEVLNRMQIEVDLVFSDAGRIVLAEELGITISREAETLCEDLKEKLDINLSTVRILRNNELDAPPASGSYPAAGMIVAPCSMGTLSAIAHGFADNLIRRAADVMIKQRRPLILLTRETPLSTIHLENMLKLSRLGVVILPPMPAFYHKPETIQDMVDFVVGRVLEVMGIDHSLYRRWKAE